MTFLTSLRSPSTRTEKARGHHVRSFQVEPLEGRALQSALTPAALRQAVLTDATMLGMISVASHNGSVPGYKNIVTRSGQVNDVASNGTVIESNGSCFDYVSEALTLAGARGTTNPGPNNFYVWGTPVVQLQVSDSNPRDTSHPLPASDFAAILPGEVIQFGNVQLSDGSFNAVQHSAIIIGVGQSHGVNNGQITVLQQNANNQHFVTSQTLDLTKMTEGHIAVYQPTSA